MHFLAWLFTEAILPIKFWRFMFAVALSMAIGWGMGYYVGTGKK